MMKIVNPKSVFLFAFFILINFLCNASIIQIEKAEEKYNNIDYLSLLEDKDNSFTISDILTQPESSFKKFTTEHHNLGFTRSAYWLKFEMYNNTESFRNRVISIDYRTLNFVEFYEFKEGELSKEVFTGDMEKFSSRDVNSSEFAFHLNLAPKTHYTYYIKVFNQGESLRIPIALRTIQDYYISGMTKMVTDGFLFGLLFFVVIFNLLMFITLKEILYLYYTIYCFLFSFFLFIMDGYSFQFLWPDNPWLANHSSVFIVSFANNFLLFFTQKFLELKKLNKKIFYINEGLKIAFTLIAFSSFLNYPFLLLAIKLANILSGFAVIFIIVVSIISLKKGSLLARYFILSFVLLMTAVVFYVARNLGIVPNNFFSEHGLKLSFTVEVIILSVAVTDRFKRIRDRTRRELEILVKEKTAEVVSQKEEIEKEKEKSEQLLLNILPEKVVADLKEKGRTEPEGFENVTIFFSDIVGFTKLAAGLDPKDLINELNEKFTVFDEIMEKHNCERLKTIGDGYLAVCGMPEENSNHAENIAEASIEIIDYMISRKKTTKMNLQVRIGIHTGKVVGGIVGIKKYAYDVFGDTINTASRMESSSEPMRINVSEDTYQILKEKYNFEKRNPIEVKGKGTMNMYFLKE